MSGWFTLDPAQPALLLSQCYSDPRSPPLYPSPGLRIASQESWAIQAIKSSQCQQMRCLQWPQSMHRSTLLTGTNGSVSKTLALYGLQLHCQSQTGIFRLLSVLQKYHCAFDGHVQTICNSFKIIYLPSQVQPASQSISISLYT